MSEPTLFDVSNLLVEMPTAEPLTDGEKRNRRQAEAVRGGFHPLYASLGLALKLHPDAAPFDDREAPGLRCGTCRFRQPHHGGSRSYPKCLWPDPEQRPAKGWPRVTHGPGTDAKAFWPACLNHEPREETP